MNLKNLKRNNEVWLLLGIVVGAIVLFGAMSMFDHTSNAKHLSQPSLISPLVCGGIATQSWYLYSSNGQVYTNESLGMCAISSSPSCTFPAGYYTC